MTMFDIIIPIYKIEFPFLQKCLNSVNSQTFKDFDVWVVDGTPEDWDGFQENMELIDTFPHFNYVRQEGKGVSQARNQGINQGNSPYIAFLDGDDYWYDAHLEELIDGINNSGEKYVLWWTALDWVVNFISYKTGEKWERLLTCNHWPEYINWEERAYRFYLSSHHIVTSGVCLLRERFEMTEGFDEELGVGEDILLWMEMVGDLREGEIYLCKQLEVISGFHRSHENSTSENKIQSGMFDGNEEMYDSNFEKFIEKCKIPSEEERPDFISPLEWKDMMKGYRKII